MSIYDEKCHIGIDVSKKCLDVFVLPLKQHYQFNNNSSGIRDLVSKLKPFPCPHIVMEATGGYEKPLAKTLAKKGFSVAVLNPRQIRDFGKALGKLAKTDKIDAHVIALFAEKIQPPSNVACNEKQQALADHNARRKQIIEMITMEKNRLDKASKLMQKSIQRTLQTLTEELQILNQALASLINKNKDYAHKNELLKSIKGVGTVVAASLISDLPELGTLQAKQISALAGIVPYNRDSGTFRGKRAIFGGRASVRTTLYMATLVATRHNPQIKQFYTRLCKAGKQKKVAIIACMHKLLIIMNAMIKNDQPWRQQATILI